MKPKTIILMVVAVVCGLVASYLTSRMLAQQGGGEEEKVKILVAKQKIPMGTLLKEPEKFFVEKEYTKGTEPKKAFTSLDQLKDQRLNKTLSAEVHVTADDLMSNKDIGPVDELAAGTRAMAITVNAATQVSGFVTPHSHVDIVATTRGDSGPLSRIILQDVMILAVDTTFQREEGKPSIQASTVTLQVKPDEAETLTLAQSLGELRLILRSPDDHENVSTQGSKPHDLIRGVRNNPGSSEDAEGGAAATGLTKVPDVPSTPRPAPAPVTEAEPVVQTHTLTIYNGEAVTKAVFVLNDKNGETRIERTPLEAPPARKEKDTPETAPKTEKDTPDAAPGDKAQTPAPRPHGK